MSTSAINSCPNVSRKEEAEDYLSAELLSFEQKLAGGEAMPDAVFFEFLQRITVYINEIAPMQEDKDNLIEEVNKRILTARQQNFAGRFEQLYQAIAYVPDDIRSAALEEANLMLESLRVEGNILGLREEVYLRILDLAVSALAKRPVGNFGSLLKKPGTRI